MIWINVGVPVFVWLCQAFLPFWHFKCHFLYLLSVSVILIQCSRLPICVCPFRASSIVLSDLFGHLHTSQDSEWIHLKITIYFAGLLYREISSLIKFIAFCSNILAGRPERDPRWRSCSHPVKQGCCQTGNPCYCSALNCLYYLLCNWWSKDLSCCPLPRAFSLASCWLEGKESCFLFLRITFHLLPWRTLGTFSQSPQMKYEVISKKFKLPAFAFSSGIQLEVMKQLRSCRIILMNQLWCSFWILWRYHAKWPYSPLFLGFSCPAIFFFTLGRTEGLITFWHWRTFKAVGFLSLYSIIIIGTEEVGR